MIDAVAFQTRARTIDHLGREQIADVPTAISELWKNAYDAYARAVSLHIYGGAQPVAAIFDDGIGMNRPQFVEKWLVVGTESKVGDEDVPPQQRQGLSPRPKQGQKGIGRLSVAALGSTVLVVSKQAHSPFVACLIDWRLFENPYLYLEDVRVPVAEFDVKGDLAGRLPELRHALLENLTGSEDDPLRASRIADAWRAFDQLAERQSSVGTISQSIRQALESRILNEAFLADWPVWKGSRPTGTALMMSELNSALLAWTLEGEAAAREDAGSIRDSLVRTLTGFSDPYAAGADNAMDYAVVNHTRQGDVTVVAREDGYGLDFLRTLDHCFEGEVDDIGIFRGRVRAFGRDLGEVELGSRSDPTDSIEGPNRAILNCYRRIRTNSSIIGLGSRRTSAGRRESAHSFWPGDLSGWSSGDALRTSGE